MNNSKIQLTPTQQEALDKFYAFYINPLESVFIIEGYSGTGKSTLVKTILDNLPNYTKTLQLLHPKSKSLAIELTATTNKAAENFSDLTDMPVRTIHSFLGLRVQTDFRTNETTLSIKHNAAPIENTLLFIDEASFIDNTVLRWIFDRTQNCKIVFIGDPAQLAPIKSTSIPVFDLSYPKVMLTDVIRQAEGSQITELATQFRNTVNTGVWTSFKPNNAEVFKLSREEFEQEVHTEFTRPGWHCNDSKILAWTNQVVINYNNTVSDWVGQTPELEVGDYAVVNSFIYALGKEMYKTNQTVLITAKSGAITEYGVTGKVYNLNNGAAYFMPDSFKERNDLVKKLRANNDIMAVANIENSWIDLRAAYACTVDKSQGSTYEKVFIDLDNISRCNSANRIARMLYVAVSRARSKVYLVGDLV
jgi:ATP-dependent exoDNAse (exonuclease V) alpha subunit